MKNENMGDEELYLAPETEQFEEAAQIAQATVEDQKFVFRLKYDANYKENLLSILHATGAIVERDNEESYTLSTYMNMAQLAFIKSLEYVERVETDVGINPFLVGEAEKEEQNDEISVDSAKNDAVQAAQSFAFMVNNVSNINNANTATAEEQTQNSGLSVASESTATTTRSSCSTCPTNINMANALEISDESYTSGNICCPGAEQWFKFTATRTGKYTICTTGSLDTIGTLYDCYGNQISEVDDYAPCGKINFRIIENLMAGATYYVKVRVVGDDTGNYTLRVTESIFADYVTINKDTITIEAGVLYELPITSNYIYKGYNGAQPIPGLSVSLTPTNASEQKIWWYESYGSVIECSYGWDDDGDRYIHVTATGIGTAKLYAEDWNENGMRDECTVMVTYCGGENYRDVAQHSMVLQSDGYYVCSKCGYRIKSPALQDKDILSDEDYYKVLSCYLSIPYYSKMDGEDDGNYSVKATALRIMIDDIRSKSQYSLQYEYVGSNGTYKREYTAGDEDQDFYMPVSIDYNIIDNISELMLNNGVASGVIELIAGLAIPSELQSKFQFLFFDLLDGYTNLTDFLCELAERAGYHEISIMLKLILFGASVNEMDVTDKVVTIRFSVGAAVYISKTVFDSNGNLKFQEHSIS